MSNEPQRKLPRKGTKSCSECRRRKLRCTWSYDGAPKCQRCEARDQECAPQLRSQPSTSDRPRPTKHERISRLEQQVARLVATVHSLERQKGPRPPADPLSEEGWQQGMHQAADDSDVSESESAISDVAIDMPRSYLNSLFDNKVISSDDTGDPYLPSSHATDLGPGIASRLSDAARIALQPLIPPKDDVAFILSKASDWLPLLHALLPSPFVSSSGKAMLSKYDQMSNPAVDGRELATWLLCVAISAQQLPDEAYSADMAPRWGNKASKFCKTVASVVKDAIVSRDAILATVEGMEAALMLFRIQISRGAFKKTWLQIRHLIAIAELAGFPSASDEPRATLWESVYNIDRFSSMMFGLPSATRNYPRKGSDNVCADGKVISPAFLSRLSEIAVQLEDVMEVRAKWHLSSGDLCIAMLKVDGDLRALASEAPPGWWQDGTNLAMPDRLMQQFYSFVMMRAHLPAVLRQEVSPQFSFSRTACIEACFGVVRSYLSCAPFISRGFFARRVMDLQVVVAVILVLLNEHNSARTGNNHDTPQTQLPQATSMLVSQVLDCMQASVSSQELSTDFHTQATNVIRALNRLLAGDYSEGLVLRVPLLGKIHVRRRRPSMKDQPHPCQGLDSRPTGQPDTPNVAAIRPSAHHDATSTIRNPLLSAPISWLVEDDYGSLFEDVFMAEDIRDLDSAMFNFNRDTI